MKKEIDENTIFTKRPQEENVKHEPEDTGVFRSHVYLMLNTDNLQDENFFEHFERAWTNFSEFILTKHPWYPLNSFGIRTKKQQTVALMNHLVDCFEDTVVVVTLHDWLLLTIFPTEWTYEDNKAIMTTKRKTEATAD